MFKSQAGQACSHLGRANATTVNPVNFVSLQQEVIPKKLPGAGKKFPSMRRHSEYTAH
jgi:hypothetical protein